MKKYNLPFVKGDVRKYKGNKNIDLVVIRNPAIYESEDLVKNLIKGGYVISNNYHNNARQLAKMDDEFKPIGILNENSDGRIYLEKEIKDFGNKIYVFQRKALAKK